MVLKQSYLCFKHEVLSIHRFYVFARCCGPLILPLTGIQLFQMGQRFFGQFIFYYQYVTQVLNKDLELFQYTLEENCGGSIVVRYF